MSPDEDDETYAGNAAIKARALRTQLLAAGIDAPVIADDSGLEVAALAGRPGVRSARYGAPDATWSDRRRELLAEVAATGFSDREARFICALSYLDAAGEIAVRGEVAGAIAAAERGDGGFSFDSIFLYPPLGRTFAEIDEAKKNAISHRGVAARALIDRLAQSGSEAGARRREKER